MLTETFSQLGFDHRFVLPYSPRSYGFIERQHKTVNQDLRTEKTKTNWALRLPIITASIDNTSIEGSPYTSSQYALGMRLNLPGRHFVKQSRSNIMEIPQQPTTAATTLGRQHSLLGIHHARY